MADAQLKVQNQAGALVGLVHATDPDNTATGLSAPVVDFAARTQLAAILTELGAKLEAGGTVALDAATLAALESVTVGGTVALDAASLAALETIQAVVSGTVSVGNLPAVQTVDGTVAVSNHPTPQTDALTDAQMRATPVPVSGTVTTSADPTSQALLEDIKRGVTDYRKLIDWDVDGQPVYVGLNAQAALTTATDWTIQRITWVNGLPTDVQVLEGVWNNRTALAWSA